MAGRVHRGVRGLGLLSTQYFIALSLDVFVAVQEGLKFTLEDARLLLVCVQGGSEACQVTLSSIVMIFYGSLSSAFYCW